MNYGKIGLTTVAVTRDLLSEMPLVLKLELTCLWNSILPEPGKRSAQLSELIRFTACKKAMHAMIHACNNINIHSPWMQSLWKYLGPYICGAGADDRQIRCPFPLQAAASKDYFSEQNNTS